MKKSPVTGKMELETARGGMEVTLHFTPDEEGQIWTVETLKTLLEQGEITHGYTSQSLKNIILQLSKSPQKGNALQVAVATPPKDFKAATPEWADCSIPSDMEEDARTFFAHLQEPKIYTTRYKEVKVKQTVTTKRFFFRPRKQEVEVKKKKKIRVPLGVDPRVFGEGWAEKGTVLATMLPKTVGKDGIDVFGRPIPAEQIGKPLNLGSGVERKGDKLEATLSGFLRRGEDWVEVLPFQPNKWEVSLSKDQNTFLLGFQPGEKHSAPPSPDTILKKAEELGAPEGSLMSSYELGTLLQRAIDTGEILSESPISTDSDGSFSIQTSEDKLQAFLSMKKSRGRGKPLILKNFGRVLKQANYFGINYDKIQKDVLAFYRGPDKELTDYLLVEGIPPEPPGEVSVKVTLKYLSDGEVGALKGRETENSSLPHWSDRMKEEVPSLEEHPLSQVDRMAMTTKGAKIAEVSWKPGKSGRDVYGNSIPSGEVGDMGFHLFEGLEKKGNQILSTQEGVVDQWGKAKKPSLRVRPHRDCFIGIVLAADRMSASLSLRDGAGLGEFLTLERVEKACKAKGILRGINGDVLVQTVEKVRKEGEVEDIIFAAGHPPSRGSSKNLEILVPLSASPEGATETEGSANQQNRRQTAAVKEGTLLAKISPIAKKSQEGWDVTGRPLPPLKGAAPVVFSSGENVQKKTDEEGNTLFYAEKSGRLVYERGHASIDTTHTVSGNVGEKSGSIKFPGTVRIDGKVERGHYVMAEEDIYVANNVEEAMLSAGKSVHVKGDILGKGKGVVRARDTINAVYAEGCTLYSIGNVVLSGGSQECAISTNGQLILRGTGGAIIGGSIQAQGGLDTFDLGSEKRIPTAVSFGQDYLIQNRIGAEERGIQKAKEILIQIEKKLKQAGEQRSSTWIRKLHEEKRRQLKLINKKNLRALLLREKFEEHHPGEIRIRGTVYPGVTLETHGRTLDFDRELRDITLYFDEETGKIVTKENQ